MSITPLGKITNRVKKEKIASKKDALRITKAIHAFSLGATISQAADYVGVCRQTLSTWINENPDMAEEVAKARGYFAVSELNPELKKKDPYKYLKALYPEDFRDEPQVAVQINQEITQLSDNELEQKVRQLLAPTTPTE